MFVWGSLNFQDALVLWYQKTLCKLGFNLQYLKINCGFCLAHHIQLPFVQLPGELYTAVRRLLLLIHPPKNSTSTNISQFLVQKNGAVHLHISLVVPLPSNIDHHDHYMFSTRGIPTPNLEFAAINSACISQLATGCFPPMI